MLTISVIGTGAIGGYYGAKLARGGQDVHFLLHRDYEHVKEHGLYVKSCDGDFRLDKVDIEALHAIAFDPYTHGYYQVSQRVGEAFKDGLKLMK